MSYYALAVQLTGELIQVSTEPLIQGEGQIVKLRQGDIPDLTKYEWHNGSLAFVEKDTSRILTKLAFMRRLTQAELAAIYTLAKTQPIIEVWLEMFKLSEEISLDDPDLISGLVGMESMGILSAGRSEEVLS